MTAAQKSQVRIGVATAVIGGLTLLAFTKLSGQVILRPEIDALESRLRGEIRQVESTLERKLDETKDIALDGLCATAPTHRRCRPNGN